MARSDMSQIAWCWASVCSETKSQKVSCAVWACGISRSGCGLAAWMTSGNLMPSWMKKTGMLLPTRSKLPSLGVELDREAAGVAHGVGRAARARDGREAHEHRCLDVLVEERRRGQVGGAAVAHEDAVRAGAAGVHHPLGDALVVEVGDLLAQVVVLQQGRVPASRPAASGRCRAAAPRWTWSGRRPAGSSPWPVRRGRRRWARRCRATAARAWAAAGRAGSVGSSRGTEAAAGAPGGGGGTWFFAEGLMWLAYPGSRAACARPAGLGGCPPGRRAVRDTPRDARGKGPPDAGNDLAADRGPHHRRVERDRAGNRPAARRRGDARRADRAGTRACSRRWRASAATAGGTASVVELDVRDEEAVSGSCPRPPRRTAATSRWCTPRPSSPTGYVEEVPADVMTDVVDTNVLGTIAVARSAMVGVPPHRGWPPRRRRLAAR